MRIRRVVSRGLVVERLGVGDQPIDVPPDGVLPGVPEKLLCGRVPRRHLAVRADRDDRGWAHLQQGLVVLLLTLQLTDVVVDDEIPGRLALLDHRHDDQLDVRKRAVPAGSLGDRVETPPL